MKLSKTIIVFRKHKLSEILSILTNIIKRKIAKPKQPEFRVDVDPDTLLIIKKQ